MNSVPTLLEDIRDRLVKDVDEGKFAIAVAPDMSMPEILKVAAQAFVDYGHKRLLENKPTQVSYVTSGLSLRFQDSTELADLAGRRLPAPSRTKAS